MSLIHIRNFMAPFQNKMHIGALIVIAVLVAVVRLSGKPADRVPGATGEGEVAENADAQIVDFLKAKDLDGTERARMDPGSASKQPRGDDFLNQLMEKDLPSSKQAPQKEEAPAGGLNDIKKSLGLE